MIKNIAYVKKKMDLRLVVGQLQQKKWIAVRAISKKEQKLR